MELHDWQLWQAGRPTVTPRKLFDWRKVWDQTDLPGQISCRAVSSRQAKEEEEEEPMWQRQPGLYMNSCMN